MAGIVEKFKAQSVSASILLADHYQHYQKGSIGFLSSYPRPAKCLRMLREQALNVHLSKTPGDKKAHYKNLVVCGSVWSCPVCASKISEYRKNEIEELIEKTTHLSMLFVTFTLPHYNYQSCSEVMSIFKKARKKMKEQQDIKSQPDFVCHKRLMQYYQYDGSVTTVEVTYGRNGWHIHSHDLYFFNKPILDSDIKNIRENLFSAWSRALFQSGLVLGGNDFFHKSNIAKSFYTRGVDVEKVSGVVSRRLAVYMSKTDIQEHLVDGWGVQEELTKSHLKMGKTDNLTPFAMLSAMVQERENFKKYAKAYLEYTKAFKGKSFIQFSRGLKKKYGIKNVSDEEILTEEKSLTDFYGMFSESDWERIKKYRLRGWVIDRSGQDWDKLQEELKEILDEKDNKNESQRERFFKQA